MNGITELLWISNSMGYLAAKESAKKKNLVLETPEKVEMFFGGHLFGKLS
jgi:hypothetical protein